MFMDIVCQYEKFPLLPHSRDLIDYAHVEEERAHV